MKSPIPFFRLIIFFYFSFLFFNSVFAQNQLVIDSLEQVIEKVENDSNKIETILNLGELYERQNPDTAIYYYNKALSIAKKIHHNVLCANCNSYLGYVYLVIKPNINKTEEHYLKAIKYLEIENDKKGIAKCHHFIGVAQYFQGSYNKALFHYTKSFEIFEELGDKESLSSTINNIAIVYTRQGSYDKAIIYYLKNIKINDELGNKKGLSNCFNGLGEAYRNMGLFKKALSYYKKSIKLSEEIGNKQYIASCYNNIGEIHRAQGIFDEAILYYLKSLKIDEELGNNRGISDTYGNIGIVYYSQGSYDIALSYYRKKLEISEKIDDNIGISSCYTNIGIFYKDKGNYEKALSYYFKALKIAEEIGDKKEIAGGYNNIGRVYNGQANKCRDNTVKSDSLFSTSLVYYQKSLKLKEEIGDKIGIASTYCNISAYNISHADLKRKDRLRYLDTAIVYGNKSLQIAEENSIRPTLQPIYENLSIAFWGLNFFNKALRNFNKLIELDNSNILMNFSFISEKQKENFFNSIETDYMKYNSFALQYQKDYPSIIEIVFNNTLKNKGLLLKSNTAMRNAVQSSNDTLLIKNYENWILLKKQIVSKYSKGESTKELEILADSLEGYLVKNSQEFSDFKKVQNISWKDVQAGLKENEVAIEFLHFPLFNPDSNLTDFTKTTQYVALIVTQKCKQPEMLPLFAEKQLENIIGKFGGNNYSYINHIYGKNSETKTELYNLIWKPMEESLKDVKTVYLSPSGLLHKISFAAIAKEQNIYLCDNYNIEVKSSTGKIIKSEGFTQSETLANATLFGGINYNTDSSKTKIWSYLEGTKTETEKIKKILKKKKVEVNYFSNTTATEEEFKLMASNSNILHIATHGFFYPDPEEIKKETTENIEHGDIAFRGGERGFGVSSFVENKNSLMRSGLVFAGANDVWNKQEKVEGDDGVLTAQEVVHIDMRKTNLVVMSACETGLGDIKGSEGVYGLQRAFKMAGVKYLIMSLWQVPDKETEEFMTIFYTKLLNLKNIKTAFNQTQKEMRQKYDPYFWAAFVLIE